jgi:hypothetical protein
MARQIRTTAEATAPAAPEPEQPNEAAQEPAGPSVTFVNNITNRWLTLKDGTKYRFPDTKVTTSDPNLIDSLTELAKDTANGIFIQPAE